MRSTFFSVTIFCLGTIALTVGASAAPFQGLGYAQGQFPGFSNATGISADGKTVVGYTAILPASAHTFRAFRWTAATGLISLTSLSGTEGFAYGVSGNGAIVAGYANQLVIGPSPAVSWDASGNPVNLDPANSTWRAQANAVSSDGTTIVGTSNYGSPSPQAFVWTAGTGVMALPFSGGFSTSTATGVSSDGSVIVGSGDLSGTTFAYRWTAASGMVSLGTLPGSTGSQAFAVSLDGAAVVGQAGSTTLRAFRWLGGGMVDLGTLPGNSQAIAYAVNGGGTVVAGTSFQTVVWDYAHQDPIFGVPAAGPGAGAFRWTANLGMQSIQGMLAANGVDLSHWTLVEARGVSSDGTVFAGNGLHNLSAAGSSVFQEAWTATIPLDAFAQLDLAGTNKTLGSLLWGGTVTNSAANTSSILTFGGSNAATTFIGTVQDGAGKVALVKTGFGTTILTGNNTYTGDTTISAGTLQVGNGGTTGQLGPGAIVVQSNAQLAFERSDSVTFSGNVSGAGSVQQMGSGTLIVTGALANTGVNVAFTDMQIGNGGTTGSISGDVQINLFSTLTFNRSDTYTYGGRLFGTGSVVQAGSGTLVIDQSATFAQRLTINSGTVQIGAANTSGGYAFSDIAINGGRFDVNGKTLTYGALSGTGGSITLGSGSLTTASNANTSLASVISGSGSFSKIGFGKTILTGANIYSGGTTISGGTLQLGNGGPSGSIVGDVLDNATLAFARTDPVTFSGKISGVGQVMLLSSGQVTLTGNNTYAGATTVSAGTLSVTGSIGSSAVSVASGATLAGTGTVGATSIASGGTLAPGNSIGTLSVNGNLTLASGSIYSVEVSPTAADRTTVSGTASVNGTVAASIANGSYAFGQRFAIITAASGVTGSFASLTGIPSSIKGLLSYDSNNVYLSLSPNALAPSLTNPTGNQQKLVSAIDASVAAGNVPPAGFVPLYTLSGSALNGALDQISGQAAPNAANAVGQGFLSFLSMAVAGGSGDTDRFAPGSAYGGADAPHRAQLGAGQARVWGAAYGGHVGLSGNGASGAAGLSSNNVGMIGGADLQVADGIIAGATLGLGRQLYHSGNGRGDSNDILFGLYGRAHAGAGYVAATFGLGWHQIKTLRVVTVSGTDVLQGKQNADDYGGRIEAGWRLAADENTSIVPYGAFAGESFESPAYAETALSGASTFALSYAAQTTALGRSELGTRLDRNYALDQGTLTADLHAAWAHQLDDQPFVQASFQNLPGSAFQVAGVRPGRDTALLGLNLEVQNSSGLFFGVRGEGQFGAGTTIVEGLGNLGWRW